MNGLAWTLVLLAVVPGALLCVTPCAIPIALLLANVSARLMKNDDVHRDD
ncbi:MAG TPA: hypothetical protein VFE79_25645 [Paraburkholderia sp.]|nr:hypothetical protein [Paraburkholderia sp.]